MNDFIAFYPHFKNMERVFQKHETSARNGIFNARYWLLAG